MTTTKLDPYADWREVYRDEVIERVRHWGDKRLGGASVKVMRPQAIPVERDN